jgi:hypothetical protein
MTDFLTLVDNHGWDRQELLLHRYHSSVYQEFDEGFIMLVPSDDNKLDVLIATSLGDSHSMDMWRVIRDLLKNRKRTIVTQYERNFDKLYKASKRYGGIAYPDGIVVFP